MRLNIASHRNLLKFEKVYISANTSGFFVHNIDSLKRKCVIFDIMVSSKVSRIYYKASYTRKLAYHNKTLQLLANDSLL